MIYDCFTFFNEKDILDIRLNYLNEVVDKFVIVEASKTHQGKPKRQFFNIEEFKKFKDKIIYIFLENIPEYENTWFYENHQRNYILDILKQENCQKEDIIIIADLDEIPSIEAIETYKNGGSEVTSLNMNFYQYYLNLWNKSCSPWGKAKIMRFANFFDEKYRCKNFTLNLAEKLNQEITPTVMRLDTYFPQIENAGWHFSSAGGVDRVITKLKSFAHEELNKEEIVNRDNIEHYLRNKLDIWGNTFEYEITKISQDYPQYLLDNKERFTHLILE